MEKQATYLCEWPGYGRCVIKRNPPHDAVTLATPGSFYLSIRRYYQRRKELSTSHKYIRIAAILQTFVTSVAEKPGVTAVPL